MPKSIEFAMHDRRDGVEEGQRRFAGERRGSPSASAGEVSGPVATMTLSQSGGRRGDFARGRISISGSASSAAVIAAAKAVAVDGERAAGRQLVGVGGAHDQRAEPAHLGMQQADGACLAHRRSGTNWSRPVRRIRRSCARRSRERAAFRAAPPARRGARSARRPRSPKGRRRRHELAARSAS